MSDVDGPTLTIGADRTWLRLDRLVDSSDDQYWRVEGHDPSLRADFIVKLTRRDVTRFAEALLAGLDADAARGIAITETPSNPVTLSLCRLGDDVATFAMITPHGGGQANYLTMELPLQSVTALTDALHTFREALR